ncbi:MAG: TIM barrel protein, partial [Spirochaetales bacterium]|nr:TIM barrel protein [Spirochaetales bacterium]
HPMYADTRSAVNTLAQANQIAAQINRATGTADQVCSVVDVYHLWWDPDLEGQIQRAGDAGVLGAFHVCDWRVPTEHMLLDRGLMGEGCIDIRQIRGWVERAGFDGLIEVEIFSERYWKLDQEEWLAAVARACRSAV